MSAQLTIIIPTRNHASYISAIAERTETLPDWLTVHVLDSSDDEDTYRVVEAQRLKGWTYERVPTEWTADRKTIYALSSFRSEYGWVVGDGCIPDWPALSDWLRPMLEAGWDCIHLLNTDAHDIRKYLKKTAWNGDKTYTDSVQLFNDFFWTLTFLGATLVNRPTAQAICTLDTLSKYMDSGFAMPCALLEALSRRKFKAVAAARHYYWPNPEKKESIWMKDIHVLLEIWTRKMPAAVNALPAAFDERKADVIGTVCLYNNYLSRRGLIRWRGMNGLDTGVEREYENDLLKTTNVDVNELRRIAGMPKGVCKMVFLPFYVWNALKRHKNRIPENRKKDGNQK